VISQSVLAMKPLRGAEAAGERLFSALEYRRVRTAELSGVERIPSGLLDSDISGHGSNSNHTGVVRTQRHNQGDGVVGGGIGIDQEGTRHVHQDSIALF